MRNGNYLRVSLVRRAQLHFSGHGSSLGAATAAAAAAAAAVARHLRFPLAAHLHSSCTSSGASSAAGQGRADVSQHQATSSSSSEGTALLPDGVHQQSCKVAGKTWTFETGRLARLAHGSCVVTVGGTSVLSTAVVDPNPQMGADGVPLQVEYRERLSAAGKLPSRPDRRERSGTDRELLAGRLVDRAVRPLLAPGHLYDTQVWCQVLAADGCIDPEVVAINAASAALLLAGNVPFTHPVGAVRAAQRGHRVLINPSVAAGAEPAVSLSLTFAGSPHKATAIEATAKQVANRDIIRAMRHASTATSPLIHAQLALSAAAGGSSRSTARAVAVHILQQQHAALPLLWPSQRLQQAVQQLAEQPLQQLFSQRQQLQQGETAAAAAAGPDKESRAAGLSRIRGQLLADLRRTGLLPDQHTPLPAAAAAGMETEADALRAFDMLQSRVMRQQLLQGGCRVDGRQPGQLRAISCQAGPLARCVHGSGLFSRGETQSMATVTVGHDRDLGQVETLFSRAGSSGSNSRLYLHYAFRPSLWARWARPASPTGGKLDTATWLGHRCWG
ncbi:hypothetical protein COO60DRAFT_322562 [Scenedesmus sp. NREL 46B-D3]|nr:hypothetical protein COO60DRAFT_322562 [Scenedesmus sp. NREL 46B-D3]